MAKKTSGEKFEVIRIYDPAIRWVGPDATNAAKYARSRDAADLRLMPGKEATVFLCQRLRRSRMLIVDGAEYEADARDRAFAHGVLEIRVPGAEPIKPAGDHWTAEELEELEHTDIQEVGSVVIARSRTPFGFALHCPVLPSSLDVYRLAVSLSAEQSPAPASPKPSAPAGASDSPPPSSGAPAPDSASRTGATAAEAESVETPKVA